MKYIVSNIIALCAFTCAQSKNYDKFNPFVDPVNSVSVGAGMSNWNTQVNANVSLYNLNFMCSIGAPESKIVNSCETRVHHNTFAWGYNIPLGYEVYVSPLFGFNKKITKYNDTEMSTNTFVYGGAFSVSLENVCVNFSLFKNGYAFGIGYRF